MNYFLLKFTHKSEIRAIIKKLAEVKYSSIFTANNNNYIVIASVISLDMHTHLVIKPNNLSTNELQIFNWAKAQIEDSIEYLKYETNSSLVKSGRGLMHEGQAIIRTFASLTEVFAILNYTHNSFSDGGKYNTPNKARQRIIELVTSGSEIIDIGVESTGYQAIALDAATEIKLLESVLAVAYELKQDYNFKISIDTYHQQTIQWLLDQDINFINDTSGKIPTALVQQITQADKLYVMMHSLVIPASRNNLINLEVNPVTFILNYLEAKVVQFSKNNIDLAKIIFDPGIGFGNNPAQAWYIMRHIHQFKQFGLEILLGHSRKSFLNHVLDCDILTKDMASSLIALLINLKVDYFRLHDLSYLNQMYAISNKLNNC
ncbi:MAG: dihydropteroate synthase [Pseudomonadota bacterium]|jgi:dihydropteroate synthase|nr:dihydropteroate synthase [Burkholderiales bacterium]